jgi:hypothetical protein
MHLRVYDNAENQVYVEKLSQNYLPEYAQV